MGGGEAGLGWVVLPFPGSLGGFPSEGSRTGFLCLVNGGCGG